MLKTVLAFRFGRLALSAICGALVVSCGGGGGGTAEAPVVQAEPKPQPAPAPEPDGFEANNVVAVSTGIHFYVSPRGDDNNPGTRAAPFKTLTRASQVAVPDSTIHVAAGTYTGEISTNASGTPEKRIYFVSDTKWGAKIVPPATGRTAAAWIVSGDNITINGFEIDGSTLPTSGTPWRMGVLTRASNIVVENNHIHHIANRVADCVEVGGAGIVGDSAAGGKNITMDRNLVHHIGSTGPCPYIHGLYMSTSGQIKNNIVHNIVDGGIHLWHDADHVDIFNNTVFKSDKGIIVGSGGRYFLFFPGDFINVANNILVDNDYGVIEESDGSGVGSHNTYVNNLFFRNRINLAIKPQNVPAIRGSIFADPQFENYDPNGNGDYRLRSGSPAIDKGVSQFAAKIDFNGNARPRGQSDDIGALEF